MRNSTSSSRPPLLAEVSFPTFTRTFQSDRPVRARLSDWASIQHLISQYSNSNFLYITVLPASLSLTPAPRTLLITLSRRFLLIFIHNIICCGKNDVKGCVFECAVSLQRNGKCAFEQLYVIDCFLLILISELRQSYEINFVMALATKFKFLSICTRQNARSSAQNTSQKSLFQHFTSSDINPYGDLLVNQKNGGSGQRPFSFTLSEIIGERSWIWYFFEQPESHLQKKKDDFIIESLKEHIITSQKQKSGPAQNQPHSFQTTPSLPIRTPNPNQSSLPPNHLATPYKHNYLNKNYFSPITSFQRFLSSSRIRTKKHALAISEMGKIEQKASKFDGRI